MIDIKDRIVEHPNRYRLKPVEGQPGVYDIEPEPGEVTESGTLINAELFRQLLLLSPETAALYGLTGDDATVDGALGLLSKAKHYAKYSVMGGGSELTATGLLPFSTEENDSFSVIDLTTSYTKMTIPSSLNGSKAIFRWTGTIQDIYDGYITITLRKNGVDITTIAKLTSIGNYATVAISNQFSTFPISIATNDYFELYATVTDGKIVAGSTFQMEVL